MAAMNNKKYIQVMISRLGLILISRHMCVPTIYKKTRFVKPFEIYIDVTLLSLCKTNVKISGEISQAYMIYGFLTALCYALSSILSECKYGKTKEQQVHSCDMLQRISSDKASNLPKRDVRFILLNNDCRN